MENDRNHFMEISVINDGKIEEMKEYRNSADFPDEKILDAQDGYVTPGFIDISQAWRLAGAAS